MLDLGVDPSKIIYANPCKQPSHLKFAHDAGVKMMTFDNADELRKIHRLCPDAKLIIRVLTDDSKSVCQLGVKFGAHVDVTRSLLVLAKELGLNVVGVRLVACDFWCSFMIQGDFEMDGRIDGWVVFTLEAVALIRWRLKMRWYFRVKFLTRQRRLDLS